MPAAAPIARAWTFPGIAIPFSPKTRAPQGDEKTVLQPDEPRQGLDGLTQTPRICSQFLNRLNESPYQAMILT